MGLRLSEEMTPAPAKPVFLTTAVKTTAPLAS